MRNFYLTLVCLFVFDINYCLGAEVGMPQLNPEFWAAQIVWLIFIFFCLYIIIWKLLLPKIADGIENRKMATFFARFPWAEIPPNPASIGGNISEHFFRKP